MTEQRKPGRPALPPGEKQDAQQPKEITMSNTTEMSQDLRAELVRMGWGDKLGRVTWGRRVSGDVHGCVVERDGVTRHYAGPFACVRRGDQIAIVRFG